MNLSELQNKLLDAARRTPPADHVPYAFERRIMARLTAAPRPNEWLAWTRALWFGAAAGNALPDLGDKIVKHTKADMQKHKGLRPALREVAKSRFVQVATWQDLTDRHI